jgi:hypothetical protein
LRYRDGADFRALFMVANLGEPKIVTVTAKLQAPTARWLAERIAFAPGMAAVIGGLGDRGPAVMERFVDNLESRLGKGSISLSGVAFVGTAVVP